MAAPATFPRDLPPVWLVVALVAIWGLHLWAPGGVWLQAPWTWVGWACVGAAVGLAGSSVLRFRRAGTGVRPFTPATAVVQTGAFRWTRNPMYIGLVGVTFGTAVGLGTWSPLIVVPAFFLLLDRRFVRAEERFLRQRFGASYDDYCRRVRRWL